MRIADVRSGSFLALIALVGAALATLDPVDEPPPPHVQPAPEPVARGIVTGVGGRKLAIVQPIVGGPMTYLQGCNEHTILLEIDAPSVRASSLLTHAAPGVQLYDRDRYYLVELESDESLRRLSKPMSLEEARRTLPEAEIRGFEVETVLCRCNERCSGW